MEPLDVHSSELLLFDSLMDKEAGFDLDIERLLNAVGDENNDVDYDLADLFDTNTSSIPPTVNTILDQSTTTTCSSTSNHSNDGSLLCQSNNNVSSDYSMDFDFDRWLLTSNSDEMSVTSAATTPSPVFVENPSGNTLWSSPPNLCLCHPGRFYPHHFATGITPEFMVPRQAVSGYTYSYKPVLGCLQTSHMQPSVLTTCQMRSLPSPLSTTVIDYPRHFIIGHTNGKRPIPRCYSNISTVPCKQQKNSTRATKTRNSPVHFVDNFSEEQLAALEALFDKVQFVSLDDRRKIANILSTTQQRIKVWFQTRRSRDRTNARKNGVWPEWLKRNKACMTTSPNLDQLGFSVETIIQEACNVYRSSLAFTSLPSTSKVNGLGLAPSDPIVIDSEPGSSGASTSETNNHGKECGLLPPMGSFLKPLSSSHI